MAQLCGPFHQPFTWAALAAWLHHEPPVVANHWSLTLGSCWRALLRAYHRSKRQRAVWVLILQLRLGFIECEFLTVTLCALGIITTVHRDHERDLICLTICGDR